MFIYNNLPSNYVLNIAAVVTSFANVILIQSIQLIQSKYQA